MTNLLIMVGSLLAALFTGGLFYRAWREKQPFINSQGEPCTEKECKISLAINNTTKKIQKIRDLVVLQPAHSSLCRIYNVRGADIPERHRYKTSISNVLTIEPESTETIDLLVNKGVESASIIILSIRTTWPKFPFISYCKHKIKIEC